MRKMNDATHRNKKRGKEDKYQWMITPITRASCQGSTPQTSCRHALPEHAEQARRSASNIGFEPNPTNKTHKKKSSWKNQHKRKNIKNNLKQYDLNIVNNVLKKYGYDKYLKTIRSVGYIWK